MRYTLLLLLACLALGAQRTEGQAFDLSGPKVDVHVKRGEATLPIAQCPNLMPGDRLWIHAELPESQSARFVLVVAFLRGVTNPPPPEWFTRLETWTRAARAEGISVAVPAEAQQALIFLAPETGGDFSTLRTAVRARPGAFVRATQDLQAASLDRMRLDAYLAGVKTNQVDPKLLKSRTEMAARSLGIRIDQQCFDKPVAQQASCLMQNSEGMVLDDSNAQSLVSQLTTGSTVDLMNQLSSSSMARGGAYSPYVGAIVDTARILASLHTAHFQYIPAMALPSGEALNLRLNVPPSFRDPKSVVVIALPPVGLATPPALHPVHPAETDCASKPELVLAAEGAPLVFATELAHGLTLHIARQGGGGKEGAGSPPADQPVDLPVHADPSQGGLVLEKPMPALAGGEWVAQLKGKWGFDPWEGPHFALHAAAPGHWTVAPDDLTALVVGRQDTVHLRGENTVCVDRAEAIVGSDSVHSDPIKLDWKSPKPGELELEIPLMKASPGPVAVNVFQYGWKQPDRVDLTAYAEAASLDRLTLNLGDSEAQLKGKRLDEVAGARLETIHWAPAKLARVQDTDQLTLTTPDSTAALQHGKAYVVEVELRDGRKLKAPVTVEPPRPQVTLLSKGAQDPKVASVASPVHLGSPDDIPISQPMVFFLKARVPAVFDRTEKVEVASVDGSFHTMLSFADGTLLLEDSTTALGMVDPLARFGASAFGPLQARVLSGQGTAGDWLPLGTLVRLPEFKELRCPRVPAKACVLSGTNLFLVTAIAANQQFENPSEVPPDFTGTSLAVPHPAEGMLYLRLRDDPAAVQTLTLPVLPMSAPVPEANPVEIPAKKPAPVPAANPVETPAREPAPVPAAAGPSEAPPAK